MRPARSQLRGAGGIRCSAMWVAALWFLVAGLLFALWVFAHSLPGVGSNPWILLAAIASLVVGGIFAALG